MWIDLYLLHIAISSYRSYNKPEKRRNKWIQNKEEDRKILCSWNWKYGKILKIQIIFINVIFVTKIYSFYFLLKLMTPLWRIWFARYNNGFKSLMECLCCYIVIYRITHNVFCIWSTKMKSRFISELPVSCTTEKIFFYFYIFYLFITFYPGHLVRSYLRIR